MSPGTSESHGLGAAPLRGEVWEVHFPPPIGPHPVVILTSNALIARLSALTAALVTGNPVRAEIEALPAPGQRFAGRTGPLRMLVVGGSLGATVLSEVVPAAIAMLPRALLDRLQIVQQAREADLEGVRAKYAELGVAAECAPYFADIPDRMRWAHLVIARAGASTLAELTCAGRPADAGLHGGARGRGGRLCKGWKSSARMPSASTPPIINMVSENSRYSVPMSLWLVANTQRRQPCGWPWSSWGCSP